MVNVKDDPHQVGNARVKWNLGAAAQDQMEEGDLPWTRPLFPAHNPSHNQVGGPHTGLRVGSSVVGFSMGGDGQDFFILGSLPQAGTGKPDEEGKPDSDIPQGAKQEKNQDIDQKRYGDVAYDGNAGEDGKPRDDSIVDFAEKEGGTKQSARFPKLPDSVGDMDTIEA